MCAHSLSLVQLFSTPQTVAHQAPSSSVQFSNSVMSDSATPWTAACQASLSITNSQSLLKLTSIELVMPSNHLILCHSLFLPPSIFPSIRVFSNESFLCIRCPRYWRFSFSISPSHEYLGLISFNMDCWISSQPKGLSRVFSNTTVPKHQFFGTQLKLPCLWDYLAGIKSGIPPPGNQSSQPRDQRCIFCSTRIGWQVLYHPATWKILW